MVIHVGYIWDGPALPSGFVVCLARQLRV